MSLTSTRTLLVFLASAAPWLCSGCGAKSQQAVRYSVDGVEFSVPKEYLIPNTVPWLPMKRASGFNFALDPRSPAESHILVNVEQRKIVCRPDKVAAAPLVGDVCAGRKPSSPAPGFTAADGRMYADDSRDHWIYVAQDTSNTTAVVPFATCFETGQEKKRQQCYSMGIYQGVIYSVLYPAEQVGKLPEVRLAVESHLSRWHQKS